MPGIVRLGILYCVSRYGAIPSNQWVGIVCVRYF